MNATKITAPTKERECGVCGKIFTITHSLQKYCPDCREGSDRKMLWVNQNIESSIRRYGTGEKPHPYDCICKNCGARFEAWIKLKYFCSKKCKDEYDVTHTFCGYEHCRKPLTEMSNGGVRNPYGMWFCCEDHQYAHARKLGNFKVCPTCKKEFFYKNTTYCSKDCYKKGMIQAHKAQAAERAKPEAICKECGKTYLKSDTAKSMFNLNGFCSITCRRKHFEKTLTGTMTPCAICGTDFFKSANESFNSFCSEVCAEKEKERNLEKKKRLAEERAEAKHLKEEKKKEREEEKEKSKKEKEKKEVIKRKKPIYKDASAFDPEWIKKNGLCGVCKTSYKDCTWMKTNFSVKPVGAFYEDSKITVCPLFKG